MHKNMLNSFKILQETIKTVFTLFQHCLHFYTSSLPTKIYPLVHHIGVSIRHKYIILITALSFYIASNTSPLHCLTTTVNCGWLGSRRPFVRFHQRIRTRCCIQQQPHSRNFGFTHSTRFSFVSPFLLSETCTPIIIIRIEGTPPTSSRVLLLILDPD